MSHEACLATIRVLYRQPDTLSLWGIPYAMRPGQQPADLMRAHDYGRLVPPGWVWLGAPGWWGNMSEVEQRLVDAFLKRHAEWIPDGPNEWSELPEDDL